jgi:opacity protein-like surface antigen
MKKTLFVLIILTGRILFAQDFIFNNNERTVLDINFNLNYNTGAKVYLNPKSADSDLRNLYYTFEGFFSYAVELKSNIWNNSIYAGLGTEYLKTSELLYSVRGLVNNLPRTLQVEEGFQLYPLELMIYYIFPFSQDWFEAYMGAGVGVYYGKYFRKIYDLSSTSKVFRLDYGILVNTGMNIHLIKNLSLKLEMKFRDPELEFKNEFSETETMINGDRIQLFEKNFYTKINLDGINLILGMNFKF